MENGLVFSGESVEHYRVVPINRFVAPLFVRGNARVFPITPLGGSLMFFSAYGYLARCLADVFLATGTIITVDAFLLF